MYQERYWKELYQLKVHVNYLELYSERMENWDRGVSVFLAITSSASIGGWAIWQELRAIWATVIALSQVVFAIQRFLPFQSRLKAVSGILRELDELLVYSETRWYDVSEGLLMEKEIHDLQFEIRRKKTKILSKNLDGKSLPEKATLFRRAQESADIYFDNFYLGDHQNDRQTQDRR